MKTLSQYLNEIKRDTTISKYSVEPEDFDEYIGDTVKVGKVKGYDVHLSSGYGSMQTVQNFLVKDPNSEGFLGSLSLTPIKIAGSTVYYSEIYFSSDLQGKGVAIPLYQFVITKQNYTIVSDISQSPGGESIWQRLSKLRDVFVYAWNTKTNQFFQWDYRTDPDEEVYGSSPNDPIRLVATKRKGLER